MYEKCQGVGHSWDYFTPIGRRPKNAVSTFVLNLRCEECGTTRRDSYDVNGRLIQRSYSYPDGYQYETGERPPIEVRRLAVIRHQRKVRRNKRAG